VCGGFVHPDSKIVLPVALEMISQQDGNQKNDWEWNAALRFLKAFRHGYPHLKTIIREMD